MLSVSVCGLALTLYFLWYILNYQSSCNPTLKTIQKVPPCEATLGHGFPDSPPRSHTYRWASWSFHHHQRQCWACSSTHSGGGRDGAQYQWERAGRSQRTGMVSQGIGEHTEASTLVQEELCVLQKAHWTHHHIKSYWKWHCILSARKSSKKIMKGWPISRLQIPASLEGRILMRGSGVASQASRVSANWEKIWREAFTRNVGSHAWSLSPSLTLIWPPV